MFTEIFDNILLDDLYAACIIAENSPYTDYAVYENQGNYFVGLGIKSYINFGLERTIIYDNGNKSEISNKDFACSMNNAVKMISDKEWRGIGLAHFELSRYLYSIHPLPYASTLLKLIIPIVEISIVNNKISISSSNKSCADEIYNFINKKFNEIKNKNNDNIINRASALFNTKINLYGENEYKLNVASAVFDINNLKYQKVIISRRVPLQRRIDMIASYYSGRKSNSPARSYILNIDGFQAAGFSPETVVEVNSDRIVSTQPLAGTRAISTDLVEDKKLESQLINDTKEIAEHTVSVKLAFDEINKICDNESIYLSYFMKIIKRGPVRHLASRLRGKMKENNTSWDAFNALFPAVTATGIPKKESIEAIHDYEKNDRGLYSGCIMLYDSNDCMDAALVLRSFYQTAKLSWIQAGAGIVEKSTPEREFEETCEKLYTVSNYIKYMNP